MKNTLIDRCANQAARAIIKEIEATTKQDLPWADCRAIIEHVGAALSSDTFNAEFPKNLRDLLNGPVRREPDNLNPNQSK